MPKPEKTKGAPLPQTKKQLAKSRKVRRRERNVTIGVTALSVIVVAILAFGSIQEYVVKPNSPVARVNGVGISLKYYQKMVRYTRNRYYHMLDYYQSKRNGMDSTNPDTASSIQYMDSVISQVKSQIMSVPQQVLYQLIDDELVRQETKKEGIVATADEIDEAIEKGFGYERNPATATPVPPPTSTSEASAGTTTSPLTTTVPAEGTPSATTAPITSTETVTGTPEPTATPGPTPTPYPTPTPMTYDAFKDLYQKQLADMKATSGITEADYRAMAEVQVLRNKLQAVLEAKVPTSGLQVHAAHILVATEEEAKTVKDRLNAGEDFAALAKELSTDTTNKDNGGDLGWFSQGTMETAFDQAVFNMQAGQISDPVQTSYGWHIIKLLERDENHKYDEATLSQKKSSALSDWLTAQHNSTAVRLSYSSEDDPGDPRASDLSGSTLPQ